jgi:N-acetylglucosamine-6-phosphate deacetylase
MPLMTGTLLHSARVVMPGGVVENGWVRVGGDRITGVGRGPAPAGRPGERAHDVGHRWVVPGFVDLHVHGGGGANLNTGDPDEAMRALRLHRAHGTTTSLASLVAAPVEEMAKATEGLVGLVEAGELAGIHLEGPFLSPARCGAQDPAYLREPSTVELDRLLQAGGGHVKMVTVAPELPGAIDLIHKLVAADVVAAIGHTDATYRDAYAGVAAGARVATHLFNGMRELHHREPGPVAALVEHPEVVCELIADGVHLATPLLRMVLAACGADRIALVTDAIAGAGASDGTYRLGSRQIVVSEGEARLAGPNGALAGSVLTQDAALRRAVAAKVPVAAAIRALSTTPARVLGLSGQTGAIVPGLRADLVVLSGELTVERVMRGGAWLPAPGRVS